MKYKRYSGLQFLKFLSSETATSSTKKVRESRWESAGNEDEDLPALFEALLRGFLSCVSLATRCLLVTLIPAAVDINPPNRWTRMTNPAYSSRAVLYEVGGIQAVKRPRCKKKKKKFAPDTSYPLMCARPLHSLEAGTVKPEPECPK